MLIICQAIYNPDVIISFQESSCGKYYYSYITEEESMFRNTELVICPRLHRQLSVKTESWERDDETSTKETFTKYKGVTEHDKVGTNGTESGILWKLREVATI